MLIISAILLVLVVVFFRGSNSSISEYFENEAGKCTMEDYKYFKK